MCGDCLFATIMTCIGGCCGRPRISKRLAIDDAKHTEDIMMARRKGKSSSKPSTRRRRSSSLSSLHHNLRKTLAQPLTRSQESALTRLHLTYSLPKTYLSPQLLTLAIEDLDTLLFASALRARIRIEWAHLPVTRRSILLGTCQPYAFNRSGISKVRIRFNYAVFEFDSKEEVWGTVLHELLHAYLDLGGGWGALVRVHHGREFERSCEGVVGRLGLEGLEVGDVV